MMRSTSVRRPCASIESTERRMVGVFTTSTRTRAPLANRVVAVQDAAWVSIRFMVARPARAMVSMWGAPSLASWAADGGAINRRSNHVTQRNGIILGGFIVTARLRC